MKRLVPLLLWLASSGTVRGQATPQNGAAPGLGTSAHFPSPRISVQVGETRSLNSGGMVNFVLHIAGDSLPPQSMLQRVNLTKVTDSLGNPVGLGGTGLMIATGTAGMLIPLATPTALTGSSPVGRSIYGPLTSFGKAPVTIRTSFSLTGVKRRAESLREVEGTLELIMPTDAEGSIVRVPNIKLHPGRIELPALASAGVVVHFLGDAESAADAFAVRTSAGLSSVMLTPPDSVRTVAYDLTDPSGRLVGCELQDAAGRPLAIIDSSAQISGANQLLVVRLGEPLAADTQLVLYLALPVSVRSVPFRLENISLP